MSAPVAAHPHEFVDTSITFRFDDAGLLSAVSVAWIYDDLTSLLILGDLGMDGDGDGELSQEETVQLTEIAGRWPEDFEGNLFITQNGSQAAMSGPQEASAGLRNGRLAMTHSRALTTRLNPNAGVITLQAYDPAYYIYYQLQGDPGIVGRSDCRVSTRAADMVRAQRLYDDALAELTDEELLEQGKFPEIGGAFAETLRLQCAR